MGALTFFIILLFVYIFLVDRKLSKVLRRLEHHEAAAWPHPSALGLKHPNDNFDKK
jgi:CcmD family protein